MTHKLVTSAIAAAFMGVLAGSAMADCSADIAKAEPMIMKISSATKKASAEKEITKAKDAAAKKNEKQCMTYLTAAKKTAGVK